MTKPSSRKIRAWAVMRQSIMRTVALFPSGQFLIYWDKKSADYVQSVGDVVVEVEICPIKKQRGLRG